MKIAIHHNPNSFSERWIKYCEEKNIDYKIVNAFDNDIIEQLKDYDIFMWHHHHGKFEDVILAKKILFSLEHAGVKVFPDFKTAWHFDDKVAQKYLLEAINAPLVPSYVFYDKETALNWAKNTSYPKVFKLKGGAGASNVKLVRGYSQAVNLINKAFGRGFSQFDRLGYFKERYSKFKSGKDSFLGVIKGLARIFIIPEFAKKQPKDVGYIYFQEFIPGLDSDIRIQVIGNRICGLKRFVRENDFRASGSGNFIEFNEKNIDKEILNIAIKAKRKINSQCLTIDFIYKNNKPMVVEVSYGFPTKFYDNCEGYWDEKLVWHKGNFNPQYWMIENLIKEIENDQY
ncbi:RimK family alpha-L-glutamate ligase [Acinetobacter sp.]|uniref:ATP-grasp domain-containing protein n=1 Tax=Acinetobacter sp. TaxID=472 RepID=UPI00388FCAC5